MNQVNTENIPELIYDDANVDVWLRISGFPSYFKSSKIHRLWHNLSPDEDKNCYQLVTKDELWAFGGWWELCVTIPGGEVVPEDIEKVERFGHDDTLDVFIEHIFTEDKHENIVLTFNLIPKERSVLEVVGLKHQLYKKAREESVDEEFPSQPVKLDDQGCLRFVGNPIVKFMLELGRSGATFNINSLHCYSGFADKDWDQFYQLIGYSVNGYGDLVSEEQWNNLVSKLKEMGHEI